MLSHILLAVLCCAAIVQDLKTRKIRNLFNVCSALLALICVLITGETTWKDVLPGFLSAFLSGILLWKLGAIRAGDAKFLWTAGIVKGVRAYWMSLAYMILAGGVMAFGIMLFKRDFRQRYRRLWLYIKGIFLSRKYDRYEPEDPQEFPFSLAIGVGCMAEWLLRFL